MLWAESAAFLGGVAFCLEGTDPAKLLADNAWPSPARNAIVLGVLGSWVLLLGLAIALGRARGLLALERIARLLLPIIPLSFLPALLRGQLWEKGPLVYLVVLGAIGFVAERTMNGALSAAGEIHSITGLTARLKRAPWLPLAFVALLALGFTLYSGEVNIIKHRRFQTGAYDLAIFDNMMWNALHGRPFRSSIMYGDGPGISIAGHAEYAMVFFAPFYAMAPGSESLIWLQAICMGLGAVTLYLFASTRISRGLSVGVAVAYLFYAPMHGSQSYDFHWLTIVTPFLFLLMYGLAKNRRLIIIPTTVLLWLLREDIAVGLVILGAFLALTGAQVRAGLLLSVSSALWFGINKFIIMPAFGTWFFADLYSELGTPSEKGYGSVVKTLLTNPIFVFQKLLTAPKLEYMLHILAPLALLPVRRLTLAALLIPGAFFTIFTNWGATLSIHYQYSAHFTAYAFFAIVVLLSSHVGRARPGASLFALLFCVISHSKAFGVLFDPDSFTQSKNALSLSPDEQSRLDATRKLASKIPDEASVIATTRDAPHLSNREKIYAFGHSRIAADYVFIHPASFSLGSTKADIRAVLDAAPYGLIAEQDGALLFKKGAQSLETEAALLKLRKRLGRS